MDSVYINIQGLSLKEDYSISNISWKSDQVEDYDYDVKFTQVRTNELCLIQLYYVIAIRDYTQGFPKLYSCICNI